MKIESIPVAQINPAPYNPRQDLKPGDPAYERLLRSINEFGYLEPVVWNKQTGHLVGGHQRFKILKARGDKTILAVVVNEPPEREKAINLALNKIDGEWDEGLLKRVLSDLVDLPDIDVTLTGFDGTEIEHLLTDIDSDLLADLDEFVDDADLVEPVTTPGDLIELGNHRLLCGDVTRSQQVHQLFDAQLASMIHTDPPYGVNYNPKNRPTPAPGTVPGNNDSSSSNKGRSGGKKSDRGKLSARPTNDIPNDDLTPKQYAKWLPKVLDAIETKLIPGGGFYIWNAHRQFGLMHDLLTTRKMKVSSTIVWAKESFSPGFGDYNEQVEFCLYGFKGGARHRWFGPRNASTLWSVHRDHTQTYRHPTQKPLELAERAIRNSSKRGEIIFDPFLGSGTTLMAAQLLGRRCFGMEIDPRHCDTIVRRYIALAGESAVSPELAARYRLSESEAA